MSSLPLPEAVMLLPKTFSTPADLDNVVSRYKDLRLQALWSDPNSFSSTYERESRFTFDTWRSRIQNPVAKTFVAVIDGDEKIPGKATCLNSGRIEHMIHGDLSKLLQSEWVGTVKLLGPEIWSKEGVDATHRPWDLFTTSKDTTQMALKSSEYSAADLVYLVVGMFVSPHARRNGYGQQLIEAAVAHVRQEAKYLKASTASIFLQSTYSDTSARLFYQQMGFEVREEVMMDLSPYTAMARDISPQMTE
ncbi:uncharacterized protein N7511_003296 [Penicillium nucicola]|uniref:uncharacterized protein n=1 Tax=Penicillium nucicola TaxID=1850975 RepID=UPI002544E5FE|nr:uncharacterized protein N7511_003296 [Penicillium nucicola]KAJ5771245.1 hypothetical protein N7511_003296 [Penicillium nucicola]